MTATRKLGLLLALVAATVVCLYPVSARYAFNWDSVNHALGTEHFAPALGQPHPPGYPVYIAATILLKGLGLDAIAAQQLLVHLATGLAVGAMFLLGSRFGGVRLGAAFAALLLASPLVILHGSITGTYALELLQSALMGWLCARLWSGERRWGVLVVAIWALLAGARPSSAVFTAPLLAVSFARAYRFALLHWLMAGVTALAIVAAWFIPVLEATGGLAVYRHITKRLYESPADRASVFQGASAAEHVLMITRNVTWMVSAVIGTLLVLLVLRVMRRGKAAPPSRPTPRLDAGRLVFALLWLLPSAGFALLLYGPHPGYLMATVPPLVMLTAIPLVGAVDALAASRRLSSRALLGSAALAAAILDVAFALVPWTVPEGERSVTREIFAALDRGSYRQVIASDALMDDVLGVVRAQPESTTQLLVLELDFNSANWRKLSWHLPEVPVTWLRPGTVPLRTSLEHLIVDSDDVPLEPGVHRLVWVAPGGELPAGLSAGFPGTERVLFEHRVSVFVSALPEGTLDVLLDWGGRTLRVHRP